MTIDDQTTAPPAVSVFVLGHRGMLGHTVARFLKERGCEIVTCEARYEGLPRDPLVEAVRASGCRWIVNAVGRIKQKCDAPMELLLVNALLPAHLKSRLLEGQRLIHASTDCVFSGRRGSYKLSDERDAEDAYGLSKILAEEVACDARCTIIRTSIIGPEQEPQQQSAVGHGLMGWFLRQRGEVRGFINHRWNGITTLEWAKVCNEVIAGQHAQLGPVVQPGVEPALSKYELLQLMARSWRHAVEVKPVEAPEAIDRTLVPTLLRPPLAEQLAELKDWYEGL